MKSDAIDVENVDVYHMADTSAEAELVAESLAVTDHTVTFTADSFSVYVVTPETYHRTYRFFTYDENMQYVEYTLYTDAGTTTYTQNIKNGESLVVPQLPSIPGNSTSTFAGWYVGTGSVENPPIDPTTITLESTEFDFNDIPAITVNGEEVHLFAKFADFAYVVFHDQYNGSVQRFPVAMTRRGEKINGTATIQISDFSVAYDDNSDENTAPSMAFYGWSYAPITQPGAHDDDDGRPVSRITTDSITIDSNVHLYPIFQPIHWLSYYSGPTGSGATYIPSKNYYVGEGPTSLSVPVRSGYTFDGWYTGSVEIIKDTEGNITSETVTYETKVANADGSLVPVASDAGVDVSNGMLLLNDNVTLFAKWIEAPVNYTIVIWRQKSTDEAGLSNDAKSYDYAESFVLTATTGANVSVTAGYQSFTNRNTYNNYHIDDTISKDSDNPYYGFTYNRCDGNKMVMGDGSTVLNVYYDRNEWTLSFQIEDYVYTIVANDNDNNPEKYGDVNGQKARVYWRNGAFRTSNSSILTAELDENVVNVVENQYINDISLDGNKTLALTNTRKKQIVTINKILKDPVVNSATFAFTGVLTDESTDITSSIEGLAGFEITAETAVPGQPNTYIGTATFELPVGAVLTVTENMDTHQSELYKGTVTPAGGRLTIVETTEDETVEDEPTEDETAENETAEENILSFTNVRKSARLTINKTVTGDMGDRSAANQFTFALMSVADEAEGTTYAWTKTTAGTTTTGDPLTTSSGSNTFTLAHGESVTIDVPLNKAIVIQKINGLYRPSWSSTDRTVTLVNYDTATVTATLTNDATVTIVNDLPAVAPTGTAFPMLPFVLMLGAGLLLSLISFTTIRKKQKK